MTTLIVKKVGTTRFELATPSTPCWYATGLRYVPNYKLLSWDSKSKVFVIFQNQKQPLSSLLNEHTH